MFHVFIKNLENNSYTKLKKYKDNLQLFDFQIVEGCEKVINTLFYRTELSQINRVYSHRSRSLSRTTESQVSFLRNSAPCGLVQSPPLDRSRGTERTLKTYHNKQRTRAQHRKSVQTGGGRRQTENEEREG